MNKILISTRLDAPIHDALKALAMRNDRTISYLLRKAVESYINPEKRASSHGQQRER
jgi:predicted transcriptional regulator